MTPGHAQILRVGRAVVAGCFLALCALPVFRFDSAGADAAEGPTEVFAHLGSPVSDPGFAALGTATPSDLLLAFEAASNEYYLRERVGAVPRAPDHPSAEDPWCVQARPRVVRCERLGVRAFIYGGDGRDRVEVDQSVRGQIDLVGGDGADRLSVSAQESSPAELSGWAGADLLRGGAAGSKPGMYAYPVDYLTGGNGKDRIHGWLGPDVLAGGAGRDELVGGGGDDEIDAVQNDRDLAVRCGEGIDRVFLDRTDPKPRGCEHVRYHAPPED